MHDSRKTMAFRLLMAAMLVTAASPSAFATTISGTVTFQGNVVFVAPIPGITETDITVSSGPGIQPTGNGEHCDIVANDTADVAAGGAYPDTGSLSVGIEISKGGMGGQDPDGNCRVQLQASGNDGANVSAYGTVTVEVTVIEIGASATVVVPDDIELRQSKTQAGLSKDCLKYTKKQMKARAKCNRTLWTLGGAEGSLKCKAAEDEPVDCDPANYAEGVVAFSHDGMNQQVDPMTAVSIDLDVVGEQAKCQNYIGKASAGFVAKRNQLVQKHCIDLLLDDEACRAQAVTDSKAKFSVIDNCVTAQMTDTGTGLVVPDVSEPCASACIPGGTLDRKCLKDCLELELSTLSDLLIGDVPLCGNDIEQAGEGCDDGNVASGDCCSATCGVEPAGSQTCGLGICEVTVAQCDVNGDPVTCTPGPAGVEAGNCGDGLDNDCDGLVDAADVVDCP